MARPTAETISYKKCPIGYKTKGLHCKARADRKNPQCPSHGKPGCWLSEETSQTAPVSPELRQNGTGDDHRKPDGNNHTHRKGHASSI